MKPNATASNTESTGTNIKHAAKFAEVLDGRKNPIRGLKVRNGRYYARLRVENPITGVKKTRRVPLKDNDGAAVKTVAQAVEALNRLKTQRSDNALPVLERTKKFKDYANDYLEFIRTGDENQKPKAEGTIGKEKTILARWTDAIGDLRLDQVKRVHVNRFIEKRLKDKAGRRTINLDVIAFRQVMKRAFSEGLIQ